MAEAEVCRIGLGLAAVGRPAYITSGRDRDMGAARSVADMRNRTFDVLDAAYTGGIRHTDAARSYGRAEEFLADWLRSRPETADVRVSSKWGYRYVGEWSMDAATHEVKDHSLQAFTTQLNQSRALLGERLDLYQVHSVTMESPVLTDIDLQNALGDLRDTGVRVGFSTSGPHQADVIRAALSIGVNGARLFSSVQSTWNILETSSGTALSEAAKQGVAAVVKEAFANGRLAPGSGDRAPGVQHAMRMAADLGIGVDQLAIAAALHQPWRPLVLSGAVNASQITSHLAGAEVELPMTSIDALRDAAEDPADYWAARSQREWS